MWAASWVSFRSPVGQQVVDLTDASTSSRRLVRLPGHNVIRGTFTDVASLKATLDAIDGRRCHTPHRRAPASRRTAGAPDRACRPGHGPRFVRHWWSHTQHRPCRRGAPDARGRFETQEAGALRASNLRFFTEDTLQRLIERSGWRVVGRDDLHSLYSEHYDEGLRDALPEEMVGALQATAQALNPNWSVTHFVWVLMPQVVDIAPSTYGEAVAPATRSGDRVDRSPRDRCGVRLSGLSRTPRQ